MKKPSSTWFNLKKTVICSAGLACLGLITADGASGSDDFASFNTGMNCFRAAQDQMPKKTFDSPCFKGTSTFTSQKDPDHENFLAIPQPGDKNGYFFYKNNSAFSVHFTQNPVKYVNAHDFVVTFKEPGKKDLTYVQCIVENKAKNTNWCLPRDKESALKIVGYDSTLFIAAQPAGNLDAGKALKDRANACILSYTVDVEKSGCQNYQPLPTSLSAQGSGRKGSVLNAK